jgi:hypothetical protein
MEAQAEAAAAVVEANMEVIKGEYCKFTFCDELFEDPLNVANSVFRSKLISAPAKSPPQQSYGAPQQQSYSAPAPGNILFAPIDSLDCIE